MESYLEFMLGPFWIFILLKKIKHALASHLSSYESINIPDKCLKGFSLQGSVPLSKSDCAWFKRGLLWVLTSCYNSVCLRQLEVVKARIFIWKWNIGLLIKLCVSPR